MTTSNHVDRHVFYTATKAVINTKMPKRRHMIDLKTTIDLPIQFFYTGTILGVEKDNIDKEIMINFRSITD